MSFESIEEDSFEWGVHNNNCFESIRINEQYDSCQQSMNIDKVPDFIDFHSYEQLSSEIDSNSMFDESLLFPSVQSRSKDGTKENMSSNESSSKDDHDDNIDMNKIVGELINNKRTDKKNVQLRREVKLANCSCKCSIGNSNCSCLNIKGYNVEKDSLKTIKNKKEKVKTNNFVYTRVQKISNPIIPKRTCRWGKAEDKIMYKQLCIACQRNGINTNTLSLEFSLTNEQHYEVLLNLKREMRWVGTTRQLLQRILKISEVKTKRSLSVRDQRLARKLALKQVKDNEIDLNVIMYHFPGKNTEEVMKICNKIFQKQANLKSTS